MNFAILIFLIINFIFNAGFSIMLAMFFNAKAKELKAKKKLDKFTSYRGR